MLAMHTCTKFITILSTFSVETITLEFNVSSVSFIDGSVDNPRCFQFAVSVSQDYQDYNSTNYYYNYYWYFVDYNQERP